METTAGMQQQNKISQLTIAFHRDCGRLVLPMPQRGEQRALGAFPLHMKIARGITASPAILGRANKKNQKAKFMKILTRY